MPEFYLTDLLNLANLEVLGYETPDAETVIFEIKPTLKVALCPKCKTPSSEVHDYDTAGLVRGLSMSGRKSYLRMRAQRFKCNQCQHSFTERLAWSAFDSSYTKRFEEHVFVLCQKNTVQDVSRLLELGYEAVEGIFKRHAKKDPGTPDENCTSYQHR